MQCQTETESPYVLFAGRILNVDAIMEARLLKNICADVTHCKSELWSYVDCKHFVPEVEQLPYFKEQVIAWAEKAETFKTNVLFHNNYADIARKFGNIVEILGEKCYD